MIMAGSNIQSSADQLVKLQEEQLYRSIVNPKPEIESKIRQLRIGYSLNPKQYAVQKRTLPYVVCGIFNPPYRRTENFAYTENFIIDIDHLSDKDYTLAEVRERIQADPRVLMCFASPSADGLKVMFRLSERCYDAGQFSIFYKEFLRRFSLQHKLDQVVDARTSDATRACFISVDKEAYFNFFCEAVNMTDYLDVNNPLQALDLKAQQSKEAKEVQKQQKEEGKTSHPADPDKEVMARIKAQLNPQAQQAAERMPVYVPQMLNDIIGDIKQHIEETGLVVTEIVNIQYAKQIRVQLGIKKAEVNLFCGKRGFTVVKSTRCGTNPELNEVVAELIQSYLYTL